MKKNNNEKRKWYFLIAVALIVGAIIGYFATQSLSTTGNAKSILKNSSMTEYEKFAFSEIDTYIIENKLENKSVLVYRESTDSKLISAKSIQEFDLGKYQPAFIKNSIVLINKEDPNDIQIILVKNCATTTTHTTNPDGTVIDIHWKYYSDGGWMVKHDNLK